MNRDPISRDCMPGCMKRIYCSLRFVLFVQAIKRGDRDVVEKWLKRVDYDVNCSRGAGGGHWSKSGTALHWAAYYGQLHVAKLLIENDASTLLNTLLFCVVIQRLLPSALVQGSETGINVHMCIHA